MGSELSRLLVENKTLAAALTAACASGDFKDDVLREFLGVFVMLGTQASAGKWIATRDWQTEWLYHGCAIIGTDLITGGPHLNPAVSLYLYALGECTRAQCISRSAAAFIGSSCAFPFFDWVAATFKLPKLTGPEYDERKISVRVGMEQEIKATAALCAVIAAFSWELPIKDNYLMKMVCIAMMVRGLIQQFPTVGPSMNPAVAIAYAAHVRRGRYPPSSSPYLVYGAAPAIGAVAMAFLYAYSRNRTFFGIPARSLIALAGGKAGGVKM
eukprot:m.204650 g.204650  ORF g.204650 m.204650 type:complete len:270 (-) comp22599_c0_seq1:68-877(-)